MDEKPEVVPIRVFIDKDLKILIEIPKTLDVFCNR
jgi:hypothetical protein